jgi:tetratricopeptide (TPR) repeat protein
MHLFALVILISLAQTPELPAARSLLAQGKFQDAATAYKTILSHDKSSAPSHAGMVQALLKLDDVAAADAASRSALELLPQSPIIHAARGDVYFRQGLMPLAEREYKTALDADPKCSRAILGLGRIYSAESKRRLAKEMLAKAHELDPTDGDALYYWAITLPYPQNTDALRKHLAEFRDDPEKERREREYLDFITALAGKNIWVLVSNIPRTQLKLETFLAPAPRTSSQDAQRPLAGASMAPRGLGLRVQLNDNTVKTFLLDTGASGVTIKKKLAEKIGARRLSEHSLEGVGNSGAVSGYNAWVDKIVIGELEFHDCIVHVSEKDTMGDADGLVGTDIFEHYLVTIDFPGRKLVLDPLPALSEREDSLADQTKSFTSVFSFGHLLLIPTHAGPEANGLFVIDTGAYSDFISPALARQTGTTGGSDANVQGTSGRVSNVKTNGKTKLQFAHYDQPSDQVLTIDLHAQSKNLGTEVSGFLGFPTLSKLKVIIDYRDGLVDFEYKP